MARVAKTVVPVMRRVAIRVEGFRPMLHHNGQLANPMNPWAKAVKEISSIKN